VSLFWEIDAPGRGPRVVMVHGFCQTRRCWGPLAAALAREFEVVRVDAPGHGRSGEDSASLIRGAALVAALGGAAFYVGYSMGARLCLQLALARPELVRGLVLIGGTPGIEDAQARAQRAAADDVLAARIEALGVEVFLQEWLRLPIFAGLPAAAAFREARAESRAAGLAASLRCAGVGRQASLWGQLGSLTAPTLCVVGEQDEKFLKIGRAMVAAIGAAARLEVIAGAGHAAHLEDPAAASSVITRWLRERWDRGDAGEAPP
jgi:2-succinyl-6-hydroxy-2,4-cyclohexadiene-1-carboxylate synthase